MCNRKISGSSLSFNQAPNSVIWKIFYYTVVNINLPIKVNHQLSSVRNNSSISSVRIFRRTNPSQALLFTVDVNRTCDPAGCYKSKCSSDSFEKHVTNREIDYDDCSENLGNENDREWQRRRKIGLANKGRVPWNKGKKHDMETRKRIKQRTIEALRDPMVRKKMAEHPRTHSYEVRVKISSSLKHVWGERLMKKRLNEKFFHSWMESIAIAAKEGGKEQEELDWDSYDKIKQEILCQKLQLVAEKVKLKEMRAETAAKTKAEKKITRDDKRMQLLSRIRIRHKRKAKERKEIQRDMKKLTATERLRLKQRLKKIRKKISINGQVGPQRSTTSVVSCNASWEKLDLELIKKGKMRKEKSLADQIQVAKTRKAESIGCKLHVASTFTYPYPVRSEK